MNTIYKSISITYYSTRLLVPHCMLCTYTNGIWVSHELDYMEACKLAWELVRAGGKRTYTSNPFKPAMHFVHVDWKERK